MKNRMHSSMDPVKLFAKELKKTNPSIDLLALYIAQIRYPDLDIDENLAQLDELADQFISELNSVAPGYERAHRFLTIFSDEQNFQGNLENYYHADNSFLNRVLARRAGLPILLSLVCIAIGSRIRQTDLDVDIQGVGLPSHFMVRYVDVAGIWLLDPFYGKVLPPEDAATYLSSLFNDQLGGKIMELPTNILRPVSTQMLLYRVLNNLRMLYINDSNYQMAIQVLDFMLEIAPQDTQLWKERGLLNHHCSNLEQASRDLRRYFFLKDQWMIASGIVPDEHLDMDIPSGFLLDSAMLDDSMFDALDESALDEFGPDDATEDHAAANWGEDSFSTSLYGDPDEAERDDDLDDDLDEYEYVELSDEEYYLLNVLTDIEEMRISLN